MKWIALIPVTAVVLALLVSVSLAHENPVQKQQDVTSIMDPDGDGNCNHCREMKVSECMERLKERKTSAHRSWMHTRGGDT